MKRQISTCLLLLATMAANAQTDYTPMLKEGKMWCESFMRGQYTEQDTLIVNGDSIFEGKRYFRVYKKYSLWEPIDYDFNMAVVRHQPLYFWKLMRDEGRKVYYLQDGVEHMLYDFTLKVGDVITVGKTTTQEVKKKDVISVRGRSFRRLHIIERERGDNDEVLSMRTGQWVEGIGSDHGLAYPNGWTRVPGGVSMDECWEDDKPVFYKVFFKAVGTPCDEEEQSDGIATPTTIPDRDHQLFNLQGRRVNGQSRPGIYIGADGRRKVLK